MDDLTFLMSKHLYQQQPKQIRADAACHITTSPVHFYDIFMLNVCLLQQHDTTFVNLFF